jgi:S1-C subfamily serine protease
VHRILARFGSQTGLLGSGLIGVNWELLEEKGARFYMVRELRSGLPAEKAGLKIGDRILACNRVSLAAARTDRDAKRLCHVEAGEILQLDVRRANSPMELFITAERRPGL